MKLYYDLHIHTALSPCCDDDMTPINIINMSVLKGLDVIAITDHNSAKNCSSCIKAAEGKDVLVIPGMEIQTKEEVHLLCFFRNIKDCVNFEKIIDKLIPRQKNNPNFFGRQLIFDKDDNIIGEEKKLLITSVDISVNQVFSIVSELKGVVVPAHVDKRAYSIISNLGFLPKELDIRTIEISKNCNEEKFLNDNAYFKKLRIIRNSDAHFLGDISEKENYFNVKTRCIDSIIDYLLQ